MGQTGYASGIGVYQNGLGICRWVLSRAKKGAQGASSRRLSALDGASAPVTAAAATAESGQRVFSASVVGGVAHVAAPIARFVGVEVVKARLSAARKRTVVSVTRVKSVVHVPVETSVAVKPRAGSNKQAADKPVGPILAIGRAIVRSVVEVAVGANGSHSNFYGNLGRAQGRRTGQRNSQCCQSKDFSE